MSRPWVQTLSTSLSHTLSGNAWNEYVMLANEDLALQFDRFEYIK